MKIACVLADGFEDSEFKEPYEALKKAGHEITILGIKSGEELTGAKKGEKVTTEKAITDVKPEDFRALLIPGGHSPDKLRANDDVVQFVQHFYDLGRLIMAICHGPQLMLAADRYKGYKITAWKTVQADLNKAGADVVDTEVVADGQMITSRQPEDIPAFIDASLKALNTTAA